MNTQNATKMVGLLGALLMTFGITYFDFDNITNAPNLRPGVMMIIGAVGVVYFLRGKQKAK